jgi:RNA polymerase sigma factor (sigma-70 family)
VPVTPETRFDVASASKMFLGVAIGRLVESMRLPRNPGVSSGVEGAVEGRPPDEDTLVERARAGDTRAYEELVRTHQAIAFRTAYLVAGSAEDAQDAAQEAFVKAYRALGRFRRGAPFRPWLLRIVANEAKNRRRAAGRRASLALRLAATDTSGGAAPSPEGDLAAAERRRALVAALGRLREEDQLVVACRFFLDLSEEETADALGLRRGTVKSRLSRSLARLRAELEREVVEARA